MIKERALVRFLETLSNRRHLISRPVHAVRLEFNLLFRPINLYPTGAGNHYLIFRENPLLNSQEDFAYKNLYPSLK